VLNGGTVQGLHLSRSGQFHRCLALFADMIFFQT
jgi:hypothetical protein